MKICRYNKNKIGLIINNGVIDITKFFSKLSSEYPFPIYDKFVDELRCNLDKIGSLLNDKNLVSIDDINLETPVANPSKIIGAPLNYLKHFEEVNDQFELHQNNFSHTKKITAMGLFLKSTSSLIGPSEKIKLELSDRRCDHEIELVAIIGKECKKIKKEDALNYVLGYSVGLDMTIRGPEERSLRKSLDSFSVLGPWLVTSNEIFDPSNLDLELKVNGITKQKSNTSKLIMNIPELIEYASKFYTLYPGDLIYSGTPEGVGQIFKNDLINAKIQSIGELNIKVI